MLNTIYIEKSSATVGIDTDGHRPDDITNNKGYWSAGNNDLKTMINLIEKHDLKHYSVLRNEDYLLTTLVAGNIRYTPNIAFIQVFQEAMICEIASIEDKEERLTVAIDNANLTVSLIAETSKELMKAADNTPGDRVHLLINSELYEDLSCCIEEITFYDGTNCRFKSLYELQRINGNACFEIGKNKLSGPTGLISVLTEASDSIACIQKKTETKKKSLVKRKQAYYQLWSNVMSKIPVVINTES